MGPVLSGRYDLSFFTYEMFLNLAASQIRVDMPRALNLALVAGHGHWRLGDIGLVIPQSCAVGMEGKGSPQIAVGAHLAVAMVALERAFGRVELHLQRHRPPQCSIATA